MKYSVYCCAVLSICLLAACGPAKINGPAVFANQNGTLTVVSCSRGCEQYVIQADGTDNVPMYVVNMPDSLTVRVVPSSYKGSELPVIFSGTRSDELEQISKADANDVPQPVFKAYRLKLTALRRR